MVSAVRAAGGDGDSQQVECMLANLIHQGCFVCLNFFFCSLTSFTKVVLFV
jgi:hypothetical protein